jgi:hypothetical protein
MQTSEGGRQRVNEDRIALALLALFVLAAFSNVVFGGKSLLPSENWNPLDYRDTAANYGPRFVPHEEWLRRDLVPFTNYRDVAASILQLEPARELLTRSLRRGELPFWDPYVGGGSPSFATLIPGYLFPPTLAIALLGNGSAISNIYILLLILCAGILTYFLLRQHALAWPACVAGAVAFAFSGAVIQTAPSALGQPVALFSLPLLATARLYARPGARRAAQLALALAFVAFTAFPPILFQVFGTTLVYALVASGARGVGMRAAKWFIAAVTTGAAMAAIVYVPALPVIHDSTHISAYYANAAIATLEPRLITQLLSPTIMGGAAIYARTPLFGGMSLHLYYAGVVALLLAGIGFLARASPAARVLKITAIIAGGLSVAKIFGVPPVQWLTHVPVFRNIHYAAYFGILVVYAVAIMAALGADAIVAGRARKWQIAASAATLGLTLALVRVFAWRYGVHFDPDGWRWIADFRLLVLFSFLAAVFTWMAHQRPAETPVRLPSGVRMSGAIVCLLALLAAEGITNSAYPRQRRSNVWRHPPQYVQLIASRNSGGRVVPMPIFPANTESIYSQPTLDSLTLFTSSRMFALYQRYFCPSITHFLQGTRTIPPERVLDAANVEYFAIVANDRKNLDEAARRHYETLYTDDYMRLVRRPSVARYGFVTGYRISRNPREALEALATLPRDVVLLEQPASFPPSPGTATVAEIRVLQFSQNEVQLAVRAPRAGLLVCSESNMRGWSATVDGHPTRILAANFAFRAVEVPQGAHTIRLRYRPPGLILGITLSAIGFIACAWQWRRRLLPDSPEPAR